MTTPPIRKIPLVVLCGPTACGKTSLALELARRFELEVISADSRQVYRGMNVGTAKPTVGERARVRHHLIDVVDPAENFTASEFLRLGRRAIVQTAAAGYRPVVVGGTGLYIKVLTEGLIEAPGEDPELRRRLRALENSGGEGTLYRRLQRVDPILADRTPPGNLVRIIRALEVHALAGRPLSEIQAEHAFSERPYRTFKMAPAIDREELFERIDRRAEEMMAGGLVEETRSLLDRGYTRDLKALQTIGYREAVQLIEGRLSRGEALAAIQRETRRYAKRQLTWFRKDPSIIWVDSFEESARIAELIEKFYAE